MVANLVVLSPVVGVGAVGLFVKLATWALLIVIALVPLVAMSKAPACKFMPTQELDPRL